MDNARAGTAGPAGFGAGPRVHGDERFLRPGVRGRGDRDHPPRDRMSESISSTRPTSTARSPTRSWSGRALRGRRDRVVLATKFGNVRDRGRQVARASTAAPEYVRQACDASLAAAGRRLTSTSTTSTASIRKIPIEETVGAMAELVHGGQGAFPRAVGGVGGHASGARTRPIRSRRCRPSTRCGRVIRRRRSCRTHPRARYRLRRLQPRWGAAF